MTDDRLRRQWRFTVTPEHLIRDRRISDRAVRLWMLLDRYAGDNGAAFPLRSTLAEDLTCSPSTVDRAIGELVRHGWLTKERRSAGDVNLYTLMVAPPEAKPATKSKKRQVRPGGLVTHDDTPPETGGLVTHDDTLSSPMTTPLVTHDEYKEASLNETSAANAAAPVGGEVVQLFETTQPATPPAEEKITAQTIVKAAVDHLDLPKWAIGRLAGRAQKALESGYTPEQVWSGVKLWRARNCRGDLASFVDEAVKGTATTKPTAYSQRQADNMRRFQARMARRQAGGAL